MYEFKKLVNFHDLGGLPGAGGLRVKHRRLLRSAMLSELPREDIALLEERYSLRNIFDLRSADEARRRPDAQVRGAAYHNLEVMREIALKAASENSLSGGTKAEVAAEHLRIFYGLMVSDNYARACWRRFLEVLLQQEEGAGLFHCYAGKDRTGVAAAIILEVLGVPRKEIMADYMHSGKLREKENARVLKQAKKEGKSEEELASMRASYSVSEHFLENAYATAEREFGSFEGFIREGIGLSEAEAAQLRRIYLE